MTLLTFFLILSHFVLAVIWRRTYHDACRGVSDEVLATILLQVAGALVCFLLVPFFPWGELSWEVVGRIAALLALLTLVEAVGDVLQTRAIKRLSPGSSGLLSPTERLVVCLGGGVLFDHHLGWMTILGAVLVFAGLAVLARPALMTNTFPILALGMLAYALFGATSLVDTRFMWDINPALYLGVGFMYSAGYLLLYRRPSWREVREVSEVMTLRRIALVALVWGPGSLAALMAYQSGYTMVAPLLALSPVINAGVGWLKGDREPPSLLATACVGAGALLLMGG